MKCHHCQVFQTVPSALRDTIKQDFGKVVKITSERYCPHKKARVTSDEPSCINFILSEYFWCKKYTRWIKTILCLHKQLKTKECSCATGRNVIKAAKKFRRETDLDGNEFFVRKEAPPQIIKRSTVNG